MDNSTVVSLGALVLSVLAAAFGATVWFIRLEGKVKANTDALTAFERLYASEQKARDERQTSTVAGLIRFDEGTQRQVEDYRTHTDLKIDALGRELKAELSKISDKMDKDLSRIHDGLDKKMDKV